MRYCVPAALMMGVLWAGCTKEENGPLQASGIIETTDVIVSARAAGTLMRVLVREGDRVRAGDTLFVVDDTDLRLQRAQLTAGLDVARYQYDLTRNGARAEDIGQAEEGMRQAKLNVDNTADDVRRMSELLKVGSISEKDLVNARTRHEVAVRGYNAAKLAYEKLRRGSRTEEVSTARARQEQAAALVSALDRKIADCIALAPGDGLVTRRAMEEGEFAGIGSAVLTISRTDPVKLKIYVAEKELGRVKVGQAADLKIDSYEHKTYRGRVTYISPTAEFTPKNVQTKDDRVTLVFEVQIDVPNPNGDLKAGIAADATLLEKL